MSKRVCVIDMPALSRQLAGEIPPNSAIGQWLAGKQICGLTPCFPALTSPMQATLTTGADPGIHGIISNGLPSIRSIEDQMLIDPTNLGEYRRQISFWEQSNQLLDVPRFWQTESGSKRLKTAMLFFQNSMPGFGSEKRPAADIVLTPKPEHGPDGKLTNLCWSNPPDLAKNLFKQLGPFPLQNYWGPMAGIASSQWIAKASAIVWRDHHPDLQWVYIPHLDYDLQRFGPSSHQARSAVRDAAFALDPLVTEVLQTGGKIVLLSEYAMRDVTRAIQPNLILEEEGLLLTRSTSEGELIDYDRSSAFVMVDHQIAHIYPKDAEEIDTIRRVLDVEGVQTILNPPPPELRHHRAGDLVLIAEPDAWFDYRWWSNESEAPLFARTIDIHRKPGYDPLELFWDRARNGIPQDYKLVRGSHGTVQEGEAIFVSDDSRITDRILDATEVKNAIAAQLAD